MMDFRKIRKKEIAHPVETDLLQAGSGFL